MSPVEFSLKWTLSPRFKFFIKKELPGKKGKPLGSTLGEKQQQSKGLQLKISLSLNPRKALKCTLHLRVDPETNGARLLGVSIS